MRLILFILIICAPHVYGACGLSLVANNISVNWDLSWTAPAVGVIVSKSNPAQCTFGLAFSKGGAGSYTRYAVNAGANQLKYQLYGNSGLTNVLKEIPDISSTNDVIMVTLPAGSNPQTELFYFDIPFSSATSPTIVPSGTFTDGFDIFAYEGTDPTLFVNPPDASAHVNVSIAVPSVVALSLVDTGGVFQDSATTKNINFGNLFQGQVSRFDMRIRTNSGYSVTVQSTHNGRLKHATKNSYVDYSLYVNNVLADPTGVTPVLAGSGQTSMFGLGYPVKLVIGSLGSLPLSGTYSDSVLITVTTTE